MIGNHLPKIPRTKCPWWLVAALLLLMASTACSGNNLYSENRDNYNLNQAAPAPRPPDATATHEAYADCVIVGYGTRNYGHRSPGNLQFWAIQRCRSLAPPSLGLTTPAEVQECIYNYGSWLADRYDISGFPKGMTGSRAVTVAETICAPTPSTNQR